MKVLLVHSDDALLENLGERLTYEGFRVVPLTPLQNILSALYREDPEIVLLNWPCEGVTMSDLDDWKDSKTAATRIEKIPIGEVDIEALFLRVQELSEAILMEKKT